MKSLLVKFAIFIVLVGNLIYNYPLVTGKIFRPGKDGGFYIEFPEYVFRFKDYLENTKLNSKLILYPDDEIERFTWGYGAVDSILALFSDQYLLLQPINQSELSKILRDLYVSAKKGENYKFFNSTYRLGSNKLLYKKDQITLAPDITQDLNLTKTDEFGKWEIYQIGDNFNEADPLLTVSDNAYFVYPYSQIEKVFGLLPADTVLFNPKDSIVNSFAQNISVGNIILSTNFQAEAFEKGIKNFEEFSFDRVVYNFELPKDGIYEPILERYRLEDFGIDPSGSIQVEIDGSEQTINPVKQNDSYVFYKPIQLTQGKHVLSIDLPRNVWQVENFDNKNGYRKNGTGEVSWINSGNPHIEVESKGLKDTSAVVAVRDFNPYQNYYISTGYWHYYGERPNVVVVQSRDDLLIKSQKNLQHNFPSWQEGGEYFRPVATPSKLEIALVAQGIDDPFPSQIFYDSLKVYKIFENDLILLQKPQNIKENKSSFNISEINPTQYKGSIKTDSPHVVVFKQNYHQGWKMSIAGKILLTKHFSVDGYANAWFVDSSEEYDFKIYYQPQQYFYYGAGITVIVLIACLFYVFYFKRNEKYERYN